MTEYVSIDFVGDSMISRWDLGDYFDTWQTQNFGSPGAGIDHIEMLQGRFANRPIVVIIGINDSRFFSDNQREAYADRYINAIRDLQADKVYLFSVLPSFFNKNEEIEAINSIIRERTKAFGDIVYIDAYPEFLNEEAPRRQLYCDGLHLSPAGYQILTEALKSAI